MPFLPPGSLIFPQQLGAVTGVIVCHSDLDKARPHLGDKKPKIFRVEGEGLLQSLRLTLWQISGENRSPDVFPTA